MTIQVQLDKSSSEPWSKQLLQQARTAINAGNWPAGMKLPSIRQLATDLAVSKFTVAELYERLAAESLVVSRPGSGVYVARTQPVALLSEAQAGQSLLAGEVALMRQTLQRESSIIKPAAGWLTPEWLPAAAIRQAMREVARQPQSLSDYGPAQGHIALRRYLSEHLAKLNIPAEPQQILLTSSATHALDLCLRLYLKPGDAVLVDDPGFYNFFAMLRLYHLKVLSLPRCKDGPDLTALATLLAEHQPKAYLTNSVLSNPVGTCVSPQKAFAVLELLKQHQCLLIEDDIYADFEQHSSLRYSSLTGLRSGIYLGSLSKTISADLRVGYIAASAEQIASLTDLKLITGSSTSQTVERIVYHILTGGAYRRHLEALRKKLQDCMTQVSRKFAQRGFRPWHQPDAGYLLWLTMPQGVGAKALTELLEQQHIVLAPGSHFSLQQDADSFMRVNVTQCLNPKLWQALDTALAMIAVTLNPKQQLQLPKSDNKNAGH
ncbi:PLP-dependent aminotransferase family protein [Rheinheimera sp.]|uniref:aminotransferase-like domain-containing protein n=1 Tax=Rheinheimera sp. TaxID=1869214 RepID=UPI0027BB0D3D|nr:PLP-dependent aminotransferase family protein [Rheinheimera sp.]